MYQPHRLGEGQPAQVVALAELARQSKLVICAGAGLSQAEPTELPSGAEVATQTHTRLRELLDEFPECDDRDLTSVADAVEALADGLEALVRTVLTIADYTTAPPNYGHYVLATLVLEGAVTVMETNWDDCIERSGGRERIHVVVTDADRLSVTVKALLKLHGCATKPQTMLVTSHQLEHPPPWVPAEMAARLSDSYVVFVGIGDIAGYVEMRIHEIVDRVGGVDHVRVVARDISSQWKDSDWESLLPTLDAEHRIESTADEFLDLLAGAYVSTALMDIRTAVTGDPKHETAVDRLRRAADDQNSLYMLHWFRGAAVRPTPGASVLRSEAAAIGVIALGLLASDALLLEPYGACNCDGSRHQLIVAHNLQPRSQLERDAGQRLTHHLSNGGTAENAPTFVICGGIGSLSSEAGLPGDVVDEGDQTGVIEGPVSASPKLIDGAMVVNA